MLAIMWLTTCLTWPVSGHIRGQVVACVDLLQGHPKLLGVGLPIARPQFVRILKKRYGIEVQQRGCLMNTMLEAYVAGYNSVVVAVAKHRFGVDISDNAARDAERWNQRAIAPGG